MPCRIKVTNHRVSPQRSNNHGTSGHRVPQVAASGLAMRTFVREPDRSSQDVVPCDRLRIKYTAAAFSLIAGFPPELKRMIREALNELRDNPSLGKFLVNELGGYQSLARKRYRVIYKTDSQSKTIVVYFAGHRRDIYELFRDHLDKQQDIA